MGEDGGARTSRASVGWGGGRGEAGVGMLGGRRGRGGLLAAYLSIVAIF